MPDFPPLESVSACYRADFLCTLRADGFRALLPAQSDHQLAAELRRLGGLASAW